ncbi:MAG: hypothetical protein MJ120_00935 [Clostridia bacterium]|nr:hypothetical protein [Clostridia bacterium]
MFFRKISSLLLALWFAITGSIATAFSGGKYIFDVDASKLGDVVGNKASNVNVWDMGTQFYNPQKNTENDIFEFVEYVQLMQCTGGNAQRDLFKDPYDNTVLDDYDFTPLIKNCAGILSLGAKPHLKLGSVPMKYTQNCSIEYFETNVYPPDDYDVYYNYIAAMAQALVDEFGKEEVLSWRFGVMTEYENSDWFKAQNGKAQDSAEEYCKLYDYTVAALQDVIGEDIYVGAHSMSVSEGLWSEEIFIRHCAEGTNYKTGKKGTRICYLSASFYVSAPGDKNKGRKSLPDMFKELRGYAEKYGLYDLNYGVDEGRVLVGNTAGADSDELILRAAGYSWQAAFDARLYGQMIENDVDYFSYWGYMSGGLMQGNPTVSYHVSNNIQKFQNAKLANVKTERKGHILGAEVKTFAAFDENENVLHVMAYNYKNKVDYNRKANVSFKINVPELPDGNAKLVSYRINDDCNFFDEWEEDRKTYGIDNSCFSWSPEDGAIEAVLHDSQKRELYFNELKSKYKECSVLTPVETEIQINDGKFTLDTQLGGNEVVFYEISR